MGLHRCGILTQRCGFCKTFPPVRVMVLAGQRAAAPPLAHFATLPERNSAMAQAYATGCYSLKEIAQTFGLHYATVSRAVRAAEGTAGS